MPTLKNCFKKYGRPDLQEQFENIVAEGVSEKQAASRIIIDEHKILHDILNQIKSKAGVEADEYRSPVDPEKINDIKRRHLEAKSVEVEPQDTPSKDQASTVLSMGDEFANQELKPLAQKFGERWGMDIDEKTAAQIKDIIDNNEKDEAVSKLRLVRVRIQNQAASEGGGRKAELEKQKQKVNTDYAAKISSVQGEIEKLNEDNDPEQVQETGLNKQIDDLEKERDEKLAAIETAAQQQFADVEKADEEAYQEATKKVMQAAPHTMEAAGRTTAYEAKQQLQDSGVVFDKPLVKGVKTQDLHEFGFGQAMEAQLNEILTGPNYTQRQRGMAAAYMAALRLLNNNPQNFIGRLFSRTTNKDNTRIRIVYDTRSKGAEPAISVQQGIVTLNGYRLGSMLAQFGGEKRFLAWMETALQEEVIHLAALHVASEEEINKVADEMTVEQKQRVRELYDHAGDMTEYQVAQEYLRMIYQEKAFGVTTEMMLPEPGAISALRRIAVNLMNFIKKAFAGAQNTKAQQILRRLDNFVKGKEVWRVGPEGTQRLAASEDIGDDLGDLYDEFKSKPEGKKKIRITADEFQKMSDEAKTAFEKELGDMPQDEQSEATESYQYGERKFNPGNDPIKQYKLITTKKATGKFETEITASNVFGEDMTSDDRFAALVGMLDSGAEMIGLAQQMFGGADVDTYGGPLLRYIKGMVNGEPKKAILLGTLLGEIKDKMERSGSRELQPLYDQAFNTWKMLMHDTAQTLVAGRLLRLFRDKFMSDIYEDIILEEQEAADLRELKKSIVEEEFTAEDYENYKKNQQKGKSKEQVDADRKDAKAKKEKKQAEDSGKKKKPKEAYESKLAEVEKEIKKEYGGKDSLFAALKKKIDEIKDKCK